MGDSSRNMTERTIENDPKPPSTTKLETCKPSDSQGVRATKSSENIRIQNITGSDQGTNSASDTIVSSTTEATEAAANIETVFEKLDTENDVDTYEFRKDQSEMSTDDPSIIELSSSEVDTKPRYLSRNKSDIFSADEIDCRRQIDNIFSVKGAVSSKISRRRDFPSTVFPAGCMGCKEETAEKLAASPRRFLDPIEASIDHIGHMERIPKKRPSSARSETSARNPLTGVGMEDSFEDLKRATSTRRKDGNPVLGIGYDSPGDASSTNSGRIPPGGRSTGLW